MMTNLLENSGFESEFRAWNGRADKQVARGWYPFWVASRSTDEAQQTKEPTFSQSTADDKPSHVRLGRAAQAYATDGGAHVAGLMQTVTVQPGQALRFVAYGHAWSTVGDDPGSSESPGNVRLRIGLDPEGGLNPFDESVIWSGEKQVYDAYDDGFMVQARADRTEVTVFLFSTAEQPKRHNQVFWDDASLEVVAEASSEPDVPSTPGAVTLALESASRLVGEVVTVQVKSPSALTGIHLTVSGPSGTVPMQAMEHGIGEGGNVWSWRFVPDVPGPYTATVNASDINPLSATIRVDESKQPAGMTPRTSGDAAGDVPPPQTRRTYVLLPPDISTEWLHAFVESDMWVEHRWTVGFDPEDAVSGNAGDKTVIVVNPAEWKESVIPIFEKHYPDVKVLTLEAESAADLSLRLRDVNLSEFG
jgi:hypothetical protein